MGRRLAVLVALAVALPAAVVLVAAPAEGAPVRVLAITTASAQPAVPFAGFDGNPPRTFDFDGDGDQEIVAQNDNQYAYVLDARTGQILAQLKTTFPAGWGARSFNGPEAYREGNETVLVLVNSAAYLTKYRFDKAASTATSFAFVKQWERRMADCFSAPGSDSKPTLADLDRDGRMDILGTTEESGLFAYRGDGSLMWKACLAGGNAEATVADLDLDGWPDVVHVSDGSVVTAFNGRSGATMWSFRFLSRFNLDSGSIPTGAAVGQLDGVGGPDVVVALRDSHNSTDWSQSHAMLAALDSGGRLLWAVQDPTANPLTYAHPVIADAAGDGQNEVYWMDWNTVGHKPPPPDSPDAWRSTGPAHAYRFDHLGNRVWMAELPTYWSNKDTPLADWDGDGDLELIVNAPGPGGDGLWQLDAATGAKSAFLSVHPFKVARAPVLADLYGAGTMQMVVEVGAATSEGANGVLVYDTGKPFRALWAHPPGPYLGTVAPPPPPSAGDFAATFTIKSPNRYWQEVYVAPDTARTIVAVQMRYNGGPWMDLTKASWGAWTASQSAAAGTKVEFLAKDLNNFQSQSAPFTWLDGTLSQRSVPSGSTGTGTSTSTSTTSTGSTPTSTSTTSTSSTSATSTSSTPTSTTSTSSTGTSSTSTSTTATSTSSTSTSTPSGFTATFTVASAVNEWWVEVAVSGNRAIAGVEAQSNGGPWQVLTKQSWGNWAKSFHVPAGSTVVFRATSTDGATLTSPAVTWLQTSTGPFTANFTPKQVGNDWWVEADVGANRAIAAVEAQLNGGAWTPLAKQTWGSWAKSISAPNGTSIVFRAAASDGATATSNPVVWT